jgi:hypothetical protein
MRFISYALFLREPGITNQPSPALAPVSRQRPEIDLQAGVMAGDSPLRADGSRRLSADSRQQPADGRKKQKVNVRGGRTDCVVKFKLQPAFGGLETWSHL